MTLKRVGIGIGVAVFTVFCAALLLSGRSMFGWQALSVPTSSMRPSIPPGSLVLTHRVPISSLQVGDIITYTNPLHMRTTLTHRIIKTYTLDGRIPTFITKGDANPSPDPPVVAGLVQGRAVAHIPYAGAWLLWAKSWLGITVLVYLPAVVLMAEEVRKLSAYYKLRMPYLLYERRPLPKQRHPERYAAAAIALLLLVAGAVSGKPALAMLASNTVSLTPNHLTVAASKPACTANTSNTTTITINNSSTQSASSGSTTSSGNTNGGSATSGNATNSTSSSFNVTTNNGC